MTESAIAVERPLGPGEGVQARLARRAVFRRLARLREGEIQMIDADGARVFGRADAGFPLRARVRVHDPSLYTALALRGGLGAGEAYLDGAWSCDDLPALMRILARGADAFSGLDGRLTRPLLAAARWTHRRRRNTLRGSRRNIRAHYDLGNDFYALFLDPTWAYSCAFFEHPDQDLEAAQRAKFERVCRKLALGPEHHVLEIGCGWGGFAIHAARTRGCRVTAVTVSRAQCELAREQVARAGLSGRVEVRLEDYRRLGGRYDRVVSIEMIEAVGAEYWDTFFRSCSQRLAPDGAMLLQAITTPDQRLRDSLRDVDFIKRYVFPGGQLPSIGAIASSLGRTGDLRIEHLEDLSGHYAETLRRWRRRFLARREDVRALGHDERFLRLWDFYLASCEGSFHERYVGLAQILLAKPLARPVPFAGAQPG